MNSEKKTISLMAKYIYESGCDCCKVCARNKACNEKYTEAEENGTEYAPTEAECISGTIEHFKQCNE